MGYNTCPECGANLDPGEKCDCEERKHMQDYSDRDIDRMRGEYRRFWPCKYQG